MKNYLNSKKSIRQFAKDVMQWEGDLADENRRLNEEVSEASYRVQFDVIRELAHRAGVDFEELIALNKSKQDELEKEKNSNISRIVQKIDEKIGRSKTQYDRLRKLYISTFEEEIRKEFHNPTVIMEEPVFYEAEDTSPVPGMYGSGSSITEPRAHVDMAANVSTSPVTGEDVADEFFSVCGAFVGPDVRRGRARASFVQRATYLVSLPSEPFHVNRVFFDFSAFGRAWSNSGGPAYFHSDAALQQASASCRLRLRIGQEGWPIARTVIDEEIGAVTAPDRWWWDPAGSTVLDIEHIEPFYVQPGGLYLRAAGVGARFVVAQAELLFSASAAFQNATAQISFAEPGGIRMGKIGLLTL